MSDTISKQALKSWLQGFHARLDRESRAAIMTAIDFIDYGTFDTTSNQGEAARTFPRQVNKVNGWTISYGYLENIDKKIHDISVWTEEPPSLEQIEMVLMAVEALSSHTEGVTLAWSLPSGREEYRRQLDTGIQKVRPLIDFVESLRERAQDAIDSGDIRDDIYTADFIREIPDLAEEALSNYQNKGEKLS